MSSPPSESCERDLLIDIETSILTAVGLAGVPSVIDSDGKNDLSRWVGIMNRTNGYGSIFNYDTAADKAIVELSTCREWCRSIAAEFDLTADEPKHNPNDPPDCYVSIEGQRFGVELAQLVESEHKQRAAKDETPYAGQLFQDMQWSKERFIQRLSEVLKKKGDKYRQSGQCVDVLVIHSGETWLNSAQAREWLAGVDIERHPSIESAFLLFEYEPGREVRHWPVFCLYGDLIGARSRNMPVSPAANAP